MIKVLHPGIFTTIQDLGRQCVQAYGVPLAGAMDEYSCKIANLLAGNDEDTPLLELTMFGGSYEFLEDTLIAIAGAPMDAQLDSKPLANWASHIVKKGEQLSFSFATMGCRAYMAIAGGLAVEKIMGSASTHTRSKMGGLTGRVLQKGDILPINKPCVFQERSLPEIFQIDFYKSPVIRILPGPQHDFFVDDVFDELQKSTYDIQSDSDRMGYRLLGTPLKHKKSADIISDALFKGAVQVPGDGQPIIMLADCQTTGGYTKLCFVITPDLDLLAQCKPGDKVKFLVVKEEHAYAIYEKYRKRLDYAKAYLENIDNASCITLCINGVQYNVQIKEMEV